MRRRILAGTSLAVGLALALTGTAQADGHDDGVIHVPQDFDPALSDTRATGHHDVVGTGLRVWTEGSTSTDKVAEYVGTDTPLADVGDPSLDYDATSGDTPPGYQLVVDFDGDGTPDGILVGEETYYGDDWWLNDAAEQFVKDGAPNTGGGSGSAWYGTLEEWSAAFPDADVLAFGFSLGSGVYGDGVINSITFAGETYTFAETVALTSKDQCKNGGWATSTSPVYANQGQCVSSFARR